jgi:hypothetical protein
MSLCATSGRVNQMGSVHVPISAATIGVNLSVACPTMNQKKHLFAELATGIC